MSQVVSLMFKAAIRVNKITSIAQLRGATLHAERADETSQARLREGAEPGAALAWSKAPQSNRDYLGSDAGEGRIIR